MTFRLLLPGIMALALFSPVAQVYSQSSPPTPESMAKRLNLEVVRQRKIQGSGGYYEDKKDRIVLKLKFTNPDTKFDLGGLSGEVFVFGDPQQSATNVTLLQRYPFSLAVPARQTVEIPTSEVVTEYDNRSYEKWGVKYGGWAVLLKDSSGAVLFAKASNPNFIKDVAKLNDMRVGSYYNRDFKEVQP